MEITLTKADSEQLARSIAEEQYSDLEKEKIMKELEIKEMLARHRQELSEKDTTITSVSYTTLQLLAAVTEITFRFAAVSRTLDGFGINCPVLPQLEEANRTLTNDVANLANEKEDLNNKLKETQDCKLPRSYTNSG